MSKRYLSLIAVMLVLMVSVPLFADVVDTREITIYTHDLAEITETRVVTLEKGDGQIVLQKIATGILPGSIRLDAGDITTSALAYSQDLIDDTKLWNTKIGQQVELMLTDDSLATKGILRQVSQKNLTLESIETSGEYSMIKRSDIEDEPFELVSNGPVLEPSIVWTYSSKKNKKVTVQLSYLTTNLSWQGEHKVVPSGKTAKVEGRVVIENTTGQTLSYDKLTLLAGSIHMAGDRRRVDRLNPAPGSAQADNISSFGDLRRWTVNNSGVLTSAQTTVLPILNENVKSYDKFYVYDATIFDDRISSHLGITLDSAYPAGKVRVYEKIGNETYFVGEDKIDDTPAGSEMDLNLNQVFDLTAERIRMAETRTEDGGTSQVYTVNIGNSRGSDVTVQVLERVFGDWSIVNVNVDGQAISHTSKNARIAKFDVMVPAGKTIKLNYEILYAR